jgi:hypothetical protein
MFREVQSEQDYRGSGLHGMNRRYTQFLLDVIETGIKSGEFRADVPPALLRDMVYGGIQHHSWNYVCGRGTLDIDAIADQIVAVLCEGTATDGGDEGLKRETARLSKIVDRMEMKLKQEA